MANSKYYYNPETCQYERVRITMWKTAQYMAGILTTAGFLFIVFVAISDYLIVTDLEKTLQQENSALKNHKAILTNQLNEIESALIHLDRQDKLIHSTLFDIESSNFAEENIQGRKEAKDNHNILLADISMFNTLLNELRKNTHRLKDKSEKGNRFFGQHFQVKAKDAVTLQSIPTLKPLQDSDLTRFVSGFGVRINPFHKGRYSHPGIDFAAQRGTPVMATAPGKITTVKLSSLLAGYGNYVAIDHGNGFITQYAHMDEITVRRGDTVSKGQVIGTVGSSGGSIAPHLHYEIIHHGQSVNPMTFMVEGIGSVEYNQLLSISNQQNQSLD